MTQYYCPLAEDQILDRLTGFKQVGFYIDVGANSPIIDSLTRCFYERGWSGINVEPVSDHFETLNEVRPRDINLAIACGNKVGTLEIYVENYLTKGLSTAKKEYANEQWPVKQVPMETLTSLCNRFVKDKVIDFLKIDVEGFELNVVQGMDWAKYRPRVLCLEAVQPNSTIEAFAEWEPILFQNGYTFVEKNIHNRFYMDTNK